MDSDEYRRSLDKLAAYPLRYSTGVRKFREQMAHNFTVQTETVAMDPAVMSEMEAHVAQIKREFAEKQERDAMDAIEGGTILVASGPVFRLTELINEIIREYGLVISKTRNQPNNNGLNGRFILARELVKQFDAVAIMAGPAEADDGDEET